MANTAMGGFRFVRTKNGSKDPSYEEAFVASGHTLGLFKGDVVTRVADGTVSTTAAGSAAYGIMDGVIQYKGSDGIMRSGGNYVPAATTFSGGVGGPDCTKVRVIPVVGNLFEVDMAAACASVAAAQLAVGGNVDFVTGAGGSTTTGFSTYAATTASSGSSTANIRIQGISTDPLNDVTSTNWKAVVEFNEGTEPSATTATGL